MNLRPCPVCGSRSFRFYREGLAREENSEIYFINIYVDYYIECPYCGHNVISGNWEEAEENWNTEEPGALELNFWQKKVERNAANTD